MLAPFFILTAYRALSGLKNGFGYKKWEKACLWTTIIAAIFIVGSSMFILDKAIPVLLVMATVVALFLVYDGFFDFITPVKPNIHLYEYLNTGCITLAYFLNGADIIYLLASALMGNVLFNGFVNLGSGERFLEKVDKTDTDTGKYTTVLGFIRVPRFSNGYTRLILASIFVLYILLNTLFWHFSIHI